EIARERQEGFETRVQRGDVASIYLTENKQYILKREAQFNEAERQFALRAQALSLYLRDAEGGVIVPETEALPQDFPALASALDKEEAATGLATRPELHTLDQAIHRHEDAVRTGGNLLPPRGGAVMGVASDVGNGDFRREPREAIA